MENSPKQKVRIRKYIPGAHKALSIFAALLILIGIIQSIVFFKFTVSQTLLLAIILLLFYAILIAFLLKPKTIRIIPKRLKPNTKEIAAEISKPAKIEIKVHEPIKKKKTSKKKKSVKKKSKK